MDIDEIIKKIVNIVSKYVDPGTRILLFGSQCNGNALPTSDIDVALDAGTPLPFETMIKVKEEIGEIQTLRSIDIVDFNSVDSKLKNSILKNSKEVCMR